MNVNLTTQKKVDFIFSKRTIINADTNWAKVLVMMIDFKRNQGYVEIIKFVKESN